MISRFSTCIVGLCVLLAPAIALGQGVLVVVDPDSHVRLPRPPIIIYPPPHPIPHPRPRPIPPPSTYKIKELAINARLIEQVAQVQVSQTFVNTGSRQMEVSFVFPLPYDGAIEQMTLLVDGKEYPAKLLSADQARKLYEEIVRKNKDPALLEWMGTGLFKTSVFPVPAGASRTVNMRYTQLCRKTEGLTDFLFPLSTAKYTSEAVEKVEIRATIESAQDIKNVYSPTHSISIKRPDDKHATVTYTAKNEVPTSDFRLMYDVGKKTVGANVLTYRPEDEKEGFFLLLASPKIKAPDEERPRKTVIFVIDRSGSMSGKKIEQARGALKFVLNNLRDGDLFNIVAYDSQVESFRPELQKFDEKTRKAALGFVEGVYAGGSTNIDQALKTALGQLQDSKMPSYVIFLTDGLPTVGERNEMKIVEDAKEANKVRARIFSFGVGYDVNSRLLDRLVRANFGQSEYVRPDEDIEDRVASLYSRISAPVMTDVNIDFALDEAKTEEGPAVNRVYPQGSFDLFAGEQLVVVGRYKRPGAAKVTVSGRVGGKKQSFDFPAKLVKKSSDDTNAFVEKLWAMRRVAEILDELDLKGKNKELIEELVKLSTKHGILTPYTSFLADDQTRTHDLAQNVRRAGGRLEGLAQSSGAGAFYQRDARSRMKAAADRGVAPTAPAQAFGGAQGFNDALRSMPGVSAAEAEKESDEAIARAVRNVGSKTFYRRGDRWVESTVTEADERKAQRVEQFSREYFDLARRYGRRLSQYLTVDDPVVVELDGQIYAIEPPQR